jgi:1-acyl-sn-glycerol-3-phosphate acyltransferase
MLDQGRDTLDVKLIRGTLLLLMRVLFRIEHSGMEGIPKSGPLLLIVNHVTYIDPFWVAVRVYRTLRFMAWDRIFAIPIAGSVFRWLGAFPVSLDNPESGAFKTALRVLERGEALMIFPEGGRSPDGRLMRFKAGAARLALRTKATVVPVAVHGGSAVWRRGMWFPRPGKVRVEYLAPITPESFDATPQALTARFRSAIEERLDLARLPVAKEGAR